MLRLNGMLVMTSDLELDVQRHAFLPKTIHRQEMERKVWHHGCGEGSRSKGGLVRLGAIASPRMPFHSERERTAVRLSAAFSSRHAFYIL